MAKYNIVFTGTSTYSRKILEEVSVITKNELKRSQANVYYEGSGRICTPVKGVRVG